MDAEVDFTLMDQTCPVTASTWIKQKQLTGDKGHKTGCEDFYVYSFTANQLPEEDTFYDVGRDVFEFKTFEHFVRRSCNNCNNCDRAAPVFTAGEEAECWRPTISDVTSEEGKISTWYRCGNDWCIKILPPQDDEDRANGYAAGLTIAGIVCLSAFLPLLLVAYYFAKECFEKSPSPPPPEQHQQYTTSSPPAEQQQYKISSPYETQDNNNDTNNGISNGISNGGGTSLFDQMNSRT
mmetsp:Transcript_660/g.717  ORF Transcript_660/g.717 Transcript_660/m.717 type:complete len:237 (+) Transcript_660:602-1312(+)